MTALDERTLAPPASLRPWVAEVRVMSAAPAPARVLTRLPNGEASFVLCVKHPGGADVVAAGPNVRASYKPAPAVPLYARFAFRPGGARAFFGVALHELAGRVVPIEALWGRRAEALRGALARANGAIDRTIQALEAALLGQLDARRADAARAALVGRAVRALEAGPFEQEHIHALARRLGVSERQLRQVFREEIGISPKRYARIARIRRVVARAGQAGWGRLAVEHGFYDQAHLTAEFRDLLRVTPRAFLAGEVPVGGDC